MDVFNKTLNRVSEVAGQAASLAAQQLRIEGERRKLTEMRVHALQLRAQIGEEMYRLWDEHRLPPSSLDDLFEAVRRTMAEIEAQRDRVDDLRTQFRTTSGSPYVPPVDAETEILDGVLLPPPPVPAAPTRVLTVPAGMVFPANATSAAAPTGQAAVIPPSCPRCGAETGGKRFCGFCGERLS